VNTSGYNIQLFAQAPTAPVNWRLLSGNNREIGRGGAALADANQCALRVKELQTDVGRLRPRVRRTGHNRWMWELSLDGAPLIIAGHRFDRSIRCEQALSQFLVEFATAPIRTGVMLSGARRWERAS
jgi:hypothetical protein